jgi:hypothetical protein
MAVFDLAAHTDARSSPQLRRRGVGGAGARGSANLPRDIRAVIERNRDELKRQKALGVRQCGARAGNWLTREQARDPVNI